MALEALGYAGDVTTSKQVDQWLNALLGVNACVNNLDSWVPHLVAGKDRTVSVSPGSGMARLIEVSSDSAQTVQLDVTASTRWDLVAWVIDAGAKSDPKLVAIEGTTTKAIPSLSESFGDGQAYIPIALVQVTNGSQMPTDMVDLRVVATPNLAGASLLGVRSPREGQVVNLSDGTSWKYLAGVWSRIYVKALTATAGTSSFTSPTTMTYPQMLFPAWSVQASNFLTVGKNYRPIDLDAGEWSITAYLRSYAPHVQLESRIYVNPSSWDGSQLVTTQPSGLAVIGAAGSAMQLTLSQPSTVLVGLFNPYESGTTNISTSYARLHIARIGELS